MALATISMLVMLGAIGITAQDTPWLITASSKSEAMVQTDQLYKKLANGFMASPNGQVVSSTLLQNCCLPLNC